MGASQPGQLEQPQMEELQLEEQLFAAASGTCLSGVFLSDGLEALVLFMMKVIKNLILTLETQSE